MQVSVTHDRFKLAQVFTISRGSRTEANVLTVSLSDAVIAGGENVCLTRGMAKACKA